MTKYADMHKQAQKSGATRMITPEYREFVKKGDMVIGAFISKSLVRSGFGGEPYYQYVFATDEGNVKFHMGRPADIEVGEVFTQGMVYAIEYLGQVDIGSSRKVNKFNVQEFAPITDLAPEPSTPE